MSLQKKDHLKNRLLYGVTIHLNTLPLVLFLELVIYVLIFASINIFTFTVLWQKDLSLMNNF